jgi:hypothetical protein
VQAGKLQVKLPAGVDTNAVTTFVNGRPIPHRVENGFVIFRLDGRANAPADWAVVGP